jgi:hypothetical protein
MGTHSVIRSNKHDRYSYEVHDNRELKQNMMVSLESESSGWTLMFPVRPNPGGPLITISLSTTLVVMS